MSDLFRNTFFDATLRSWKPISAVSMKPIFLGDEYFEQDLCGHSNQWNTSLGSDMSELLSFSSASLPMPRALMLVALFFFAWTAAAPRDRSTIGEL